LLKFFRRFIPLRKEIFMRKVFIFGLIAVLADVKPNERGFRAGEGMKFALTLLAKEYKIWS